MGRIVARSGEIVHLGGADHGVLPLYETLYCLMLL